MLCFEAHHFPGFSKFLQSLRAFTFKELHMHVISECENVIEEGKNYGICLNELPAGKPLSFSYIFREYEMMSWTLLFPASISWTSFVAGWSSSVHPAFFFSMACCKFCELFASCSTNAAFLWPVYLSVNLR